MLFRSIFVCSQFHAILSVELSTLLPFFKKKCKLSHVLEQIEYFKKILIVYDINCCWGPFFVRSHVPFAGGVTLLSPDLFWGVQPET